MSKFKIGDYVVINPDHLKSSYEYNRFTLIYDGVLPEYINTKTVYRVVGVNESYYTVFPTNIGESSKSFIPRWGIREAALLGIAKEEKFRISKNRVESRHLRKKV